MPGPSIAALVVDTAMVAATVEAAFASARSWLNGLGSADIDVAAIDFRHMERLEMRGFPINGAVGPLQETYGVGRVAGLQARSPYTTEVERSSIGGPTWRVQDAPALSGTPVGKSVRLRQSMTISGFITFEVTHERSGASAAVSPDAGKMTLRIRERLTGLEVATAIVGCPIVGRGVPVNTVTEYEYRQITDSYCSMVESGTLGAGMYDVLLEYEPDSPHADMNSIELGHYTLDVQVLNPT